MNYYLYDIIFIKQLDITVDALHYLAPSHWRHSCSFHSCPVCLFLAHPKTQGYFTHPHFEFEYCDLLTEFSPTQSACWRTMHYKIMINL